VDTERREILAAGEIGEICISGPTVMRGYLANEAANASSFLALGGSEQYFRTGDLGFLDGDGYLFLAGRLKEIIKVGGEQVSPFEIESVLSKHADIHVALCFGIPNSLLGEVVGAALVLKASSKKRPELVINELKDLCTSEGLSQSKVPRMRVVEIDSIPLTYTRKFSRQASSERFGSSYAEPMGEVVVGGEPKAPNLDATSGIRFILSIIVCLNHIGDHAWTYEGSSVKDHDWFSAAVTSMRTVGDLGVVLFGMLAGFSITASMNQPVLKYAKFWESRLVPIHLVYLIASALCIMNRLIFCPPSDFGPYEWGSVDACRATALRLDYSGTWAVSLLVVVLSLQAWPFGVFVWHLSYYTWFSSAYQFCIFCYPWIQNLLADKVRGSRFKLYGTHVALQVAHLLTLVFMESIYLTYKAKGNFEFVNYFVWAGYMFPPFWALRFAIGCFVGFHFVYYRPDQQACARWWGVVADVMTASMLVIYIFMVVYGVDIEVRFSSDLLEDRMYCGVAPRLAVPIFAFYIYALAVGKGLMARLCKSRLLVRLAPASYSVYLLHQPVFEWFSAMRFGAMWSQRKRFEWFSPDPVPLNGWESAIVICLTVLFSLLVTWVVDTYLMAKWLTFSRWALCHRKKVAIGSTELVLDAFEDLVGVRPADTDRPQDLVASLGLAALVSSLHSRQPHLKLVPADLLECETIREVIAVIDGNADLGDSSVTSVTQLPAARTFPLLARTRRTLVAAYLKLGTLSRGIICCWPTKAQVSVSKQVHPPTFSDPASFTSDV